MSYFHVTPAENVDSILRNGLIPSIGERSKQMGEPYAKIFLFASAEALEDALMNWLGEQFDEDVEITVLDVSLPTDVLLSEGEAGFEVACLSPIPAENITISSGYAPSTAEADFREPIP